VQTTPTWPPPAANPDETGGRCVIPTAATTTERERRLLAALAAILLEVCDNPKVKPHSSHSYLPDHLIADAIQALQPYGWPA